MHSYCREFNALIKADSSGSDFTSKGNELYDELKSLLHPVKEDYIEKAIQKLKYDNTPLMRYVLVKLKKNAWQDLISV